MQLYEAVFLTGMPGSGKSTLGKLLAKSLELPFRDSDKEIAAMEGRLVSQIIKKEGEPYFRFLESQWIDTVRLEPCIIATGGGMPCFHGNMIRMLSLGRCIYIRLDAETIFARIQSKPEKRPITAGKSLEEIQELLKERERWYSLSSIVIDAGNRKNTDIVDEIIHQLQIG